MNKENPPVEKPLLEEIRENREALIEKMRQDVTDSPVPSDSSAPAAPAAPAISVISAISAISAIPATSVIPAVKQVGFWGLLRQERNFLWTIIGVLAWLVLTSLLLLLYLNPQSIRSHLVLGEITVTGPIHLCPGEYLDFNFEMEVRTAGVYSLDMSVFKVSPPPAIAVFSESQFFVIGSPRTFEVTRHWQIPNEYRDPETNETIQFVTGSYERNIAVGTTSQATLPSTQILPFFIRDNCLANN